MKDNYLRVQHELLKMEHSKLQRRFDYLEEKLVEARIIYPILFSFDYPVDYPVDIPELERKLNMLMKHFNLEIASEPKRTFLQEKVEDETSK